MPDHTLITCSAFCDVRDPETQRVKGARTHRKQDGGGARKRRRKEGGRGGGRCTHTRWEREKEMYAHVQKMGEGEEKLKACMCLLICANRVQNPTPNSTRN